MKYEAVMRAKSEALRFLERVEEYEATAQVNEVAAASRGGALFIVDVSPKITGALRRASMDLTRALAEMRRPR